MLYGNGLLTGAHNTVGIDRPLIANTVKAIWPPLEWTHKNSLWQLARGTWQIEFTKYMAVTTFSNRASKISLLSGSDSPYHKKSGAKVKKPFSAKILATLRVPTPVSYTSLSTYPRSITTTGNGPLPAGTLICPLTRLPA